MFLGVCIQIVQHRQGGATQPLETLHDLTVGGYGVYDFVGELTRPRSGKPRIAGKIQAANQGQEVTRIVVELARDAQAHKRG